MNQRLQRLLLATSAIVLLTPAAVLAADAPAAAGAATNAAATSGDTSNTQVGEIVVTARRIAEKLKDVPVADTVVTAKQLQMLDVTDTMTLAHFTPGLEMANYQSGDFNARLGLNSVVFRGLSLANDYGPTAAGLVYLDGAPLLGTQLPLGTDIDRVEVLRGPQSVEFGRSAMTGAVSYVSKSIPADWHAGLTVDYGQYNTRELLGTISGPIVSDKLRFSLSGSTVGNDGYYKDEGPEGNASPGYRLGAEETDSVVAQVEWRPIDTVRVRAFFNAFSDHDGVQPTTQLNAAQDNCNLGGTTNYYCGTLPGYKTLGFYQPTTLTGAEANTLFGDSSIFPNDEWQKGPFGLQRHAYLGHLIVDVDFPGIATVESISAYEEDRDLGSEDGEYVPTGNVANVYENYMFSFGHEVHDFDQEVRLTSDPYANLPLRWTLGFNYLYGYAAAEANLAWITTNNVGTPAASPNPEVFFAFPFGATETNTYGGFAGLYYDFPHGFSLSLEGRYQVDELTAIGVNAAPISAPFDSFSPRAALNYKFTPDLTGYFSFARGSRPGGFNAGLIQYEAGGVNYNECDDGITHSPSCAGKQIGEFEAAIGGPASSDYLQETLTTYEFGLKGDVLDHHIRINADGYWGQVTNMQDEVVGRFLGGGQTLSATSNLGLVNIWGAEADAQWLVTSIFQLGGTFAWNHTDIVKFYCGQCVTYIGSASAADGKSLPDAPEFTFSLTADVKDRIPDSVSQYIAPIANWSWFGHADYAYRGHMYITDFNVDQTAARNILNLRAGIQNGNSSLEVYVANALNDTNYTTISLVLDQAKNVNGTQQGAVPPPRVIGARYSYKY